MDSYLIADDVRAALLSALQSLDQAIKRDPDFVSAYCYIARANDLLYFFDLDPTPDRILLAEAAVKAALRLRPDSAEAHFAMADFLFRCHRDYDGALKELAIARPGLPNDTAFFILSGYINRRRNNWAQAERDFSTAVALDPRNPNAYNLLADTYNLQRKHLLRGAGLRPRAGCGRAHANCFLPAGLSHFQRNRQLNRVAPRCCRKTPTWT